MKTLHEKMIEIAEDGIDIMFKPFKEGNFLSKTRHMQIVFRYQPSGSIIKTEGIKSLSYGQMQNEQFVVSLLDDLYEELKPHMFPYNQKLK